MDKKCIESILKRKAKLRAELDGLSSQTSFENELEYFFPKLMDFYEKNGHFRVRPSYDRDLFDFNRRLYHKFGSWLIHKNKSKLKPQHKYEDEIDKYFQKLHDHEYLSKVIPNLSMSSIWQSNCKILETFKNREDHCLVKTVNDASRSAEDNKLGQWVALQRVKRKDGRLSTMQIKKLNELNFVWITDLGEIFEGCKNGDQRALDTRNNLINSLDSSRNEHTSSKDQDKEIGMQNELAKYQEAMHRLKIERERLKHGMRFLKEGINRTQTIINENEFKTEAMHQLKIERERLKHGMRSLREEIDRTQTIINENEFKTAEQKEQTQQAIDTLVKTLREKEAELLRNVDKLERLSSLHDEQVEQIKQK